MNIFQRIILGLGGVALLVALFKTPKIQITYNGCIIKANTAPGLVNRFDYGTLIIYIGVIIAVTAIFYFISGTKK